MIIITPNAFRDCLSAHEVASAINEGICIVNPYCDIKLLPLADGGDGTLSVLKPYFDAKEVKVMARCPLGNRVSSIFLLSNDNQVAIIEMAEISGLKRVPFNMRNPLVSSSCGTGDLILAALNLGVKKIIIGAGGSATIDGGAGALSALGVKFFDSLGNLLEPIPKDLIKTNRIDASELDPRLKDIEVIVLSDVNIPVVLNPSIFGPQKGMKPDEIKNYEKILSKIILCSPFGSQQTLCQPWTGAGGGLAAGLLAFLNATIVGGAAYISSIIGLNDQILKAKYLITGEGKFDKSTLYGKAPFFAAELAAQSKVQSFIICGQASSEVMFENPYVNVINVKNTELRLEDSLAQAYSYIRMTAENLAKNYIFNKK
jgi:glycerate kinase